MKLIWGHALVHVLVDESSDSLHIYLALLSVALLGVGRRGGFSSQIVYTHLLALMKSAHVKKKKIYSTTLGICLRWIFSRVRSGQSFEGSAKLLRVLWLLNVSYVFGGGSEVVADFFQSFSRKLACLSHPIS